MSLLRKAASFGTTALLSAAVLLGAAPANAAAPTLPPGATTLGNVQNLSELGLLQQDTSAFGQKLADDGVYLSASYIIQLMSNVSGGVQTGTYFPNELTLGATLDFQKMFGLTGSSLHVVMDKRANNDFATGAVGEGINIGINPVNRMMQLSEFYWEQALFNDRVDIIAGRTNPTLWFATSALSCAFPSALICAQPEIWYNINNVQAFPFSEWGGRVKIQATKDIYLQIGGYEDDFTQILDQENGFSWRWDNGDGAFIPVELGYQTKTAKYDVGFYHDSGYIPAGGPALGQSAHTGYWVQGQQLVYAALPRTLTLLGGALINGTGPTSQYGEYYAAAFLTAPLLSRPHDTLGLIAAYTPLNKGSNGAGYSSSFAISANYSIEVMPGVTATPLIEYIVHPSVAPYPVNNAWILGAQLYINLTQILKFPEFVAHD